MNFEELSELWNKNTKEEAIIEVNQTLLNEVSFTTIKRSLREIKWTAFFEIIVNFFWLPFLVEFMIEHYAQLRFSIPAGILIFIAAYSLVLECYKLYLYYSINHQFSILETQKKLERLNFLELFDNNSLYILIPLFLIPFLVVSIKGMLGVDLFMLGLSARVILIATGGTFVVSVIIVFFLNRFPNKELRDSIAFMKELRDVEGNKE